MNRHDFPAIWATELDAFRPQSEAAGLSPLAVPVLPNAQGN